MAPSWCGNDPDSEFAETLDELDLPGIEVIRESEWGRFALKCELNGDLSGRRLLIYRERARRLDGDWLADVEARSPSFAADYASVQLRELGAADTADMRAVLRAHKAFFAKKTNIKKVSRLAEGYDAPARLEVAVMAAALGAEEATAPAVLRAYLSAAEAEGGAEALGVLAAVGAADSFKAAVSAWTGFAGDVTDAIALAQHVLVSALAMQLPPDALGPLAPCCSVEHAPFCHALVQEWARGSQRGDLLALCGAVEEGLGLERVLADVELSALSQADTFPCIDAIILRRLFAALSAGADGVDEALALAAARRGSVWYANLPMFCREGVSAAASMRRFFRDHRHDPRRRSRAGMARLHAHVVPDGPLVPRPAQAPSRGRSPAASTSSTGLPRLLRRDGGPLQELVPARARAPVDPCLRGRLRAPGVRGRRPAPGRLRHGRG